MNPVTVIGVAGLAIVSITSHEAAHGFVADRLGDPTSRERGRLTLNPIPHIDLFFTILLPLFLIVSRSGFIFGLVTLITTPFGVEGVVGAGLRSALFG